jgi:hypothetical protein
MYSESTARSDIAKKFGGYYFIAASTAVVTVLQSGIGDMLYVLCAF